MTDPESERILKMSDEELEAYIRNVLHEDPADHARKARAMVDEAVAKFMKGQLS